MTPEKALFWLDWINICLLTLGTVIIYSLCNLVYRLFRLGQHFTKREKAMFTSPYFLNQVRKLTPEQHQRIFGNENNGTRQRTSSKTHRY